MDEILKRIETAIRFLKDGQSFSVGDLRLGVEGDNTIFVTGWSQYVVLENLTKPLALAELEDIKKMFMEMVKISSQLRKFIFSRDVKFNLALNYGMGSVGVCFEKNGVVEWIVDLKT